MTAFETSIKGTGTEKSPEASLAQQLIVAFDYEWGKWNDITKATPAAEKAVLNKATVAKDFIEFSPHELAFANMAEKSLLGKKEDVPIEKQLAKVA